MAIPQKSISSNASHFHLVYSTAAQFVIAGIIVGMVLVGCGQYTLLVGDVQGLTVVNRTMSSGTFLLMGLVLLLGPLHRLYGGFWRTVFMFRKEIGVLTFIAAFIHANYSLFILSANPLRFFEVQPWSAIPAIVGFIILVVLYLFSYPRIQRTLRPGTWWKLQYTGARMAFLVMLVHIVVLRWASWSVWFTEWLQGKDYYPPLALLAAIFAFYVLSVKVIERRSTTRARVRVPVVTFIFIVIVDFLFVFPRVW